MLSMLILPVSVSVIVQVQFEHFCLINKSINVVL